MVEVSMRRMGLALNGLLIRSYGDSIFQYFNPDGNEFLCFFVCPIAYVGVRSGGFSSLWDTPMLNVKMRLRYRLSNICELRSVNHH